MNLQDDPEMNQLTVYQRLDNSRQGKLFDGVVLPNVQVRASFKHQP
jgi:hypothetical protein